MVSVGTTLYVLSHSHCLYNNCVAFTVVAMTRYLCNKTQRSYHRMVAVGTTLYVFGGCGAAGRLSDLHAYDTTTSTWKQMPSSESIAGTV
jgi:N-acetylneuraminic acid mutarotase